MEKIYIRTFGCSQNIADSEIMAGLLRKAGFHLAKTSEESDLVIINSCAVKQPTENNFFKYLESLKDKKVVVAGCVGKTMPEKLRDYSLVGPSQIHSIVEVVEETLNGNIVTLIVDEETQKLALPKIRRNNGIEIVPISSGCLGECAYCIVRLARGALLSYPKDQIITRIRQTVSRGVNQIWLTSQDTGCYGMDNDDNYLLPALLKDILRIPGIFKIRLGMLNPNFAINFKEDLVEILNSDKIFKFLHLPVQSGNNEVLKSMRRRYTVEEFRDTVDYLRKAHPDLTISTDMILGFPGEKYGQFLDSVKLIREIKPDVLNRSRFWSRPGTEAEKMPEQIHSQETKNRSRFIVNEFERVAYERNKRWIGWKGEILIEEKGKDNTSIGRNYAYRPVIVEGEYDIGKRISVQVRNITIHDLRAVIIK